MPPKSARMVAAPGMATDLPSSVPAAQEVDRRRVRFPTQASPKGSPTASPRGSRSASPVGAVRGPRSPVVSVSPRNAPIERGGEHTPPGRMTPPLHDQPPPVDVPAPMNDASAMVVDCTALSSEVQSLQSTLGTLEAELKHYANLFSIEERRSRAEDYRTRAATLRAGNGSMRKVIASLRNSDRLLVELREQQGAVDKHMRLRKAQIRQKEATIDVITRRCREQGEGSQSLLCGIESELSLLDALCVQMEDMGSLADRVHPVGTLRNIVEHDEARYRVLEGLLLLARGYQHRSHAEDIQLRHLQDVQEGDWAVRPETANEDNADVEATIEAHRIAWHKERAALMAEKSNAQRQLRDLTFHVRRGTNVKSMSQNPCPPTAEFLVMEVRELQLTLGELRTAVESDRLVLWELERTSASLAEVRREENASWVAELQALRATHSRHQEENHELTTYERILQAKQCGDDPTNAERPSVARSPTTAAHQSNDVVHGALTLTPFGHRGDAAHGVSAAGTPAVSASEWSNGVGEGSPRLVEIEAFTKRQREKAIIAAQSRRPSNVLDRLTAPTKSRSMFLLDHRREQEERAERISSVVVHRPVGCNIGTQSRPVAAVQGATPQR